MEKGVYGTVLERDLAQRARIIAAMEGTSRSALMRRLIAQYVAEREQQIKALSEEGKPQAGGKRHVASNAN